MLRVTKQPAEDKSQSTASPSLLDAFRVRCEARAYLVFAAEYTLPEAVDQLQHDAEACGLVGDIGQDAVQAIMAEAFAAVWDDEPINEDQGGHSTLKQPEVDTVLNLQKYCDVCGCEPCRTVGFCKTCRDADNDPNIIAERERASAKLPPTWDQMSFEALSALLTNPGRLSRKGRAARSTVDAVACALRKDGKAALKVQAARLEEFSDRQIEDLIRQLKKSGADEQLLLTLAELLP